LGEGEIVSRKRLWQDDKAVRQLIARLNRIEGQVRGIKRMIEEGVYCDDILNQISAVRAALGGAAALLLEKHMKHCIREQLLEGDEQVLEELLGTIAKLIR
jgi:DNA-binding FrmR family transcriptional regulator